MWKGINSTGSPPRSRQRLMATKVLSPNGAGAMQQQQQQQAWCWVQTASSNRRLLSSLSLSGPLAACTVAPRPTAGRRASGRTARERGPRRQSGRRQDGDYSTSWTIKRLISKLSSVATVQSQVEQTANERQIFGRRLCDGRTDAAQSGRNQPATDLCRGRLGPFSRTRNGAR